MIYYTSHPHGLATVNIVFEGSNLEQEGELGCAHLLEHLVCKRLSHLESIFASEGIDFNARTCQDFTHYYIRGLDNKVKKYAAEFIRCVVETGLDFSKEEFKQEKQIVLQEWEDALVDTERNLFNRFYDTYYQTPRTLGSRDDISHISYQQMKAMAQRSYSKPVMCVIEQGTKWRVKNQLAMKDSHDSLWTYTPSSKKSFPNRNTDQNKMFLLISDSYSQDFINHYCIMAMLSDGFISPMLTKMREDKKLVYSIDGNLDWFSPSVVHTRFVMMSHAKNEQVIWKEFCKLLNNKDWFNSERFNQIKQKNLIELEIMNKRGEYTPLDRFLFESEFILHEQMKKIKFSDLEKTIDFYQPKNFILFK